MQQRRPRLGDILDDYCPRERRITNHAVVAMIEDLVKQTRCTTCDADHEYKQAKMPSMRKKKDAGPLPGETIEALRPPKMDDDEDVLQDDGALAASGDSLELDAADGATPLSESAPGDETEAAAIDHEDDGPVHRPLIRATLPRPEGQAPEWKDPEFTVRQPASNRGREFGGGAGGGQRPGRNRRPMRAGQGSPQGPMRFGTSNGPRDRNGRSGQGQGPNGNRGGGQPGGQRGGRPGQGGDQRGPGRKRGPR